MVRKVARPSADDETRRGRSARPVIKKAPCGAKKESGGLHMLYCYILGCDSGLWHCLSDLHRHQQHGHCGCQAGRTGRQDPAVAGGAGPSPGQFQQRPLDADARCALSLPSAQRLFKKHEKGRRSRGRPGAAAFLSAFTGPAYRGWVRRSRRWACPSSPWSRSLPGSRWKSAQTG